jgi:hypothetical protein
MIPINHPDGSRQFVLSEQEMQQIIEDYNDMLYSLGRAMTENSCTPRDYEETQEYASTSMFERMRRMQKEFYGNN